jgi:hypothetical protein
VFCIYQLQIDKGKNRAVLDLNPFFYPPWAIRETAKAFRAVCSTRARQKGNRLVVELVVFGKGGCERTALGFLNYALAVRKGVC